MNKFKLNQPVRVWWPEWERGNVGVIVDIFFNPRGAYHIVELPEGGKYGYFDHEIEPYEEDESETI